MSEPELVWFRNEIVQSYQLYVKRYIEGWGTSAYLIGEATGDGKIRVSFGLANKFGLEVFQLAPEGTTPREYLESLARIAIVADAV